MQLLKTSQHIIAIVMAIIGAYILAFLVRKAFFTLTISDFATYYYIPKAVLHLSRPEHPYSNLVPYYPFFYPPQSIPLFGLLSLFPFYLAKYLWTVTNVALAIYSIYIINSFYNKKIGLEFWLMLFGMIVFFPFQFTLTDGQFNIVIFSIFVLIAKFLLEKEYFKLSIPLSLGIITKISPVIVFLYLIVKRKYKAIIYTSCFILFLTMLAEFFIKHGITYYYLRHVLDDVSKQASVPSYMDQSILGLLKRFNFNDLKIFNVIFPSSVIRSLTSYSITGLFTLILLILEYINKNKTKQSFLIIYSGLVLIGLVGTGLAWHHQFIVLLLPLYIAFLHTVRLKTNKKYFLIILLFFAYLLMGVNLINVFQGFWQLTLLFGAVLTYLVLIFLINKENIIRSKFSFSKIQNSITLAFFVGVFIISINPVSLNEFLKEGRDRVRVREIDFLGEALAKYKPGLKVGKANSFDKTEKVDEGYILFENAQGDYRQKISLLPLDPINNYEYKYSFQSQSKEDFSLSAKLESKLYLKRFGENYIYFCIRSHELIDQYVCDTNGRNRK